MSSKGIGCFEKHSTHSAHMEFIIAGSSLAHMSTGFVVCATFGVGFSQHTNVTILSPVGPPAVPHQPIVHNTPWTVVCPVSNKLH